MSSKPALKWIDNLGPRSSYEYLKCLRFRTAEGCWSCPAKNNINIASEKFDMVTSSGSSPPKVAKTDEPGDHEEVDEATASKFRSSVLTPPYLASQRSDVQSTVKMLCTRLKTPTKGDARRLKKLLR